MRTGTNSFKQLIRYLAVAATGALLSALMIADVAAGQSLNYLMVAVTVGYLMVLYGNLARSEGDRTPAAASLVSAVLYGLAVLFFHESFSKSFPSTMIGLIVLQIMIVLTVENRKALARAPYMALFGLAVVAIYFMVAALAPVLAPYSESQIVGGEYEPWSATFLLGTDNLGRDMLTRLIYGARNTISIAVVATALGFFLGSTAGLLAATLGGWVDSVLGRTVDVLMAIPQLIFALLILTIVGTSITSLIIVIAVVDATRVFRLVRAVSMNVLALDFVEVARLRGEGLYWIMRQEVLPNITAPLIVEFGIRFCFVFLFISSLSFLGLGIQPPTADWGSMVRENAALIAYGDITPLLPAGAIAMLAIGVNLAVDWFIQKSSGLKE